MKASIGRIIIVLGGPSATNGTDRAPAIITRVWPQGDDQNIDPSNGPCMVNATAFCDLASPQVYGSIFLFDTEDAARASIKNTAGVPVAFWPERV